MDIGILTNTSWYKNDKFHTINMLKQLLVMGRIFINNQNDLMFPFVDISDFMDCICKIQTKVKILELSWMLANGLRY